MDARGNVAYKKVPVLEAKLDFSSKASVHFQVLTRSSSSLPKAHKMSRTMNFALALLFLATLASAQFGYNPYAYSGYNSAYNNYYGQQYHNQAPSPMQQAAPHVSAPEAPSFNFAMGSPAFAKASELFAMPKLF